MNSWLISFIVAVTGKTDIAMNYTVSNKTVAMFA
jgi:hypothetical protein